MAKKIASVNSKKLNRTSSKKTSSKKRTSRKSKSKNIKKLYFCGTSWSFDIDPQNSGPIECYTSAEALDNDCDCAEQCGIVEVDAKFSEQIRGSNISKSFKELKSDEKKYIQVGNRLVNEVKKKLGLNNAISAFKWALGTLKLEKRKAKNKKNKI